MLPVYYGLTTVYLACGASEKRLPACVVTISILIATGKPAQLAGHLGRALDNGVQPCEAAGLLAHLAVYCGWPSARRLRPRVHGEEHRHQFTARHRPAPSSSRFRYGASQCGDGAIGSRRTKIRAAHQRRGARRPLETVRSQSAGQRPDPCSDRRGPDPSGLLRGLAEGGQRDRDGRQVARQVAAPRRAPPGGSHMTRCQYSRATALAGNAGHRARLHRRGWLFEVSGAGT